MSDRDGNTLVWFLAGLGLGALAGVLYAPRSGSERALSPRAGQVRPTLHCGPWSAVCRRPVRRTSARSP